MTEDGAGRGRIFRDETTESDRAAKLTDPISSGKPSTCGVFNVAARLLRVRPTGSRATLRATTV
jgi:hypothetical protein